MISDHNSRFRRWISDEYPVLFAIMFPIVEAAFPLKNGGGLAPAKGSHSAEVWLLLFNCFSASSSSGSSFVCGFE